MGVFAGIKSGVGDLELVSALKINNNNSTGLDSLIRKISKETKQAYVYEAPESRSFVDKSVQKLVDSSIIEGYFPKENLVKDMAIKRVNKSLCIILSVLIAVVVVSYYFVLSCEIKLNDLSRQTVTLNNENEELQNKLDSLKSFNNVDKTLQQNNLLQRSGQVIETQEVQATTEDTNRKYSKQKIFNQAIGF